MRENGTIGIACMDSAAQRVPEVRMWRGLVLKMLTEMGVVGALFLAGRLVGWQQFTITAEKGRYQPHAWSRLPAPSPGQCPFRPGGGGDRPVAPEMLGRTESTKSSSVLESNGSIRSSSFGILLPAGSARSAWAGHTTINAITMTSPQECLRRGFMVLLQENCKCDVTIPRCSAIYHSIRHLRREGARRWSWFPMAAQW